MQTNLIEEYLEKSRYLIKSREDWKQTWTLTAAPWKYAIVRLLTYLSHYRINGGYISRFVWLKLQQHSLHYPDLDLTIYYRNLKKSAYIVGVILRNNCQNWVKNQRLITLMQLDYISINSTFFYRVYNFW